MYRVKFYKKDYYYFYLFKNKDFLEKFLTFGGLITYLESNNIDFKKVRFSLSLDDLFFHIVDINSVHRKISYNNFQDKKKELINNEF